MKIFSDFKGFFYLFIASVLLSFLITLIYIKIPSFYISSFNYSLVPSLEYKENAFSYNGFYQTEVSSKLVSTLALFGSQGDFKNVLQKDLERSVLFVLSKTNGNSIITLRLVTVYPLELSSTNESIKRNLNTVLTKITPPGLNVSLNSLEEFNYSSKAGISPYKFFSLTFATLLIVGSLFLLLKRLYYDSK